MAQIATEGSTPDEQTGITVTEITVNKDELALLRSGLTLMIGVGPVDKIPAATILRMQLTDMQSDLGWE
jgi:hypothetical protein